MPSNYDLVIHLFLQLTIILAACRAVGWVLRYLGQAQVVSEMIAGVLLGPSLLGLLAPRLQQYLFPTSMALTVGGASTTVTHPSMMILFSLSQVGLVLYMFLIGLEFNTQRLSENFKQAMNISVSGILVPLVMGGAFGIALAGDHRLFATHMDPWQSALFLGSAMSITAFPMLARIIHENGLTHTKVGTLAIASAAFNDAIAWCLLAVVVATTKQSPSTAWLAIGGGAAYLAAMIFVGRPLCRLFAQSREKHGEVRAEVFTVMLLVLMLCAWFTDKVGIYSVFGAFIAGAVMPRGRFADEVGQKLEPLTVSVLLPIFFVYSGLNTRMALLVQPSLFWVAVATVLIAFCCKGGGCLLASRLGGSSWREATLIGVLMNARGLMELILVNIGLQKGLITPALFTILVLMALLTTFATSPMFHLLYRRSKELLPELCVATAPASK